MDQHKEENEKKKEYLRRYHAAELAEREIREEIDDLRMNKMFPALIQDGMPHREQLRGSVSLRSPAGRTDGQPESTDGAADPAEKRNHAENRRDAG